MENLKENANKTKEMVDVTKERIVGVAKKYQDGVAKIVDDGKVYIVTMAEGYTCFGQKERKARSIPEIGFIARCATEEKNGKTLDDWRKEFKENKIAFDGKNIPEYIDTIEKVEKMKKAEAEKAEKVNKTKKDNK